MMRNFLCISLSFLFIIGGLSLHTTVFGAQPLTDGELDSITASGSFSIDILPPSALSPPTTPSTPTGVRSASVAIQAASAAIEAASTLTVQAGLPVATKAVQAASAALETVSSHSGVGATNSASEALKAASSAIRELQLDPAHMSPSVLAASKAIQAADQNLIQNSVQNGTSAISAATEALKVATTALEGVSSQSSPDIQVSTPAIAAASEAVKAASQAISVASNPVLPASSGNSAISPSSPIQPGVPESIDPALLTETPGVRFSFDAGGGTTGSGTAQIPTANPVAPNAPSQPNLNFTGNPVLSGNAFQVQNMLLNMNICVQCRASGHIVQTGNGFVFPIQIQ